MTTAVTVGYCTRCKLEKPTDAFTADARMASGLCSYCKACHLEVGNQWRQANKVRVREQARARYAARDPERVEAKKEYESARRIERHGISVSQYLSILQSQSYSCAICGTPDPGGKGGWHVDHDHACCAGVHSCGKCVRGLLCHQCNVSLGGFNDDMTVVLAAYRYLAVHSAADAIDQILIKEGK